MAIDHSTIVALDEARRSLDDAIATHKQFIAHVGTQGKSDSRINATLYGEGDKLAVTAFGQTVTANARHVQRSAGSFVTEYVFYAANGNFDEEVFRCYLSPLGRLFERPEDTTPFAQSFSDGIVAEHICGTVAFALLTADVLNPTPPKSDI